MRPLRDPANQAAVEIAADLFADLGDLVIRPMFGGAGIYSRQSFFALIYIGEIYIRTDDALARELQADGSRQFVYEHKSGKPVSFSYWTLPAAALESHEMALDLARRALKIARTAPRPTKNGVRPRNAARLRTGPGDPPGDAKDPSRLLPPPIVLFDRGGFRYIWIGTCVDLPFLRSMFPWTEI